MLASAIDRLRITLRRAASDGLVVSAAATTILLATVLLAAGPIYADAAARSALQRTLADAEPPDASVEVSMLLPPNRFDEVDDVVTTTVERAFRSSGADVTRTLESESFRFVEPPVIQSHPDATPLTVLRFVDGMASRATIEGAWPTDSTDPIEVAVHHRAAELLDAAAGESVTLLTRDDVELTVLVSGVYRLDDPADPVWYDDVLGIDGFRVSAAFATLGPLVIDRNATTGVPTRMSATWLVRPTFGELDVADVRDVRSTVSGLEARLAGAIEERLGPDVDEMSDVEVSSGLVALLAGSDRSLTVTRSSVIGLLAQLALLAGYALALTAGLLATTRRRETALLVARGAARRHIVAGAVLEGLALTLPAAALAPWLASQGLRILNHVGPLASIDLALSPRVSSGAYVAAAIASALAIVVLTWPTVRSVRELDERRHRRPAASAAQRTGLDLALGAIAVIAFWQLGRLGPRRAARLGGRLDVDPLVVLAPALGMLAGAVLALRVVPLLARTADQLVERTTAAVPALASWQVARRPRRHGRTALLLIMATTIGIFASSYSSTWLRSQSDQAAQLVGADVRVTPNRRTNDSITDLHLGATHENVAGATTSMAVERRSGPLVNADRSGQLLLLDAARAAEVVELRADLAEDFRAAAEALVTHRPDLGGLPLSGDPQRIALRLTADEAPVRTPDGVLRESGFDARVDIVVADGASMLHRIELGPLFATGTEQRLEQQLTAVADDGSLLLPRYPLTLVSIELRTLVPSLPSRSVTLEVSAVEVADESSDWSDVPLLVDEANWRADIERGRGLDAIARAQRSRRPSESLVFDVETGAAGRAVPLAIALRPGDDVRLQRVPVVTSRGYLDEALFAIGDTIRVAPLRIDTRAEIVAVVESFPTIDPEAAHAIVVDLPTLQAAAYEPGSPISPVTEYWLDTDDPVTVARALDRSPFDSVTVAELDAQTSALTTDPVARGTIGALSIGFVAAAIFAALGFAVSAAVSAHERTTEFALLRALGLSPGQLTRWIAVEQGVLVVISLVFGTIVGVLLTGAALPLISLTQSGRTVVPEVQVVYPWVGILVVVVALMVALVAVVAVMAVVLRHLRIGSLLRMEDSA